jgi:S1/P1 Nuclease
MKRITTSLVGLALVSTGIALPTPAKAWGKYGHMAICDMAYRNFTPTSREQLKIIFRIGQQGADVNSRTYTRFNMSCLEEDEIPRKHPKDHFINFSRGTPEVSGNTCPVGTSSCIIEAIDRDLSVLRNQTAAPKKRVRALMSIGHWVGDIHQPLHISFEDDKGGNYILASGACGNAKKNNLHSVWDNCLLDKTLFAQVRAVPCYRLKNWKPTTITYRGVDILLGVQPYGKDAACQLGTLGPASDTDVRNWQSTAPWQWAKESYDITLERAYDPATNLPRIGYCDWRKASNECWFDATHLGFADAPVKTVNITNGYINHFGPIVVKRVEMAGYRLAHLVNTELDPNYRGR